jgi:protein-tyrosine-phosphatase
MTQPLLPHTLPLHPFTDMIEEPNAVLFACFQNAVRSPMAEALLKHHRGTSMYVDSCGVRQGQLDPKSFEQMEDSFFDLIVSLSPEAHHRATELTRTMACDIEYWPTLDATIVEGTREMRLAAYRQVRDDLQRRIKSRFPPQPEASA